MAFVKQGNCKLLRDNQMGPEPFRKIRFSILGLNTGFAFALTKAKSLQNTV